MIRRNVKFDEVLCNSGEQQIFVGEASNIGDVLDQAGRMLNGACLTNVFVVKTKSGKYLVGEFSFAFREVSKKTALRVASNFSDEDCEHPDDRRDQRGDGVTFCMDCGEVP